VLIDTIEQVRRLWRGESMPVLDGTGKPTEVRMFPPPVQPELPVWVTSAGGVETFRNAGRAGAGLLTHLLGQDLDELAAKIAVYRSAVAEREDADGWPGHVVLMVHTYLGEDEDEVREQVRAPLSAYLRSSLSLLLGSQTGSARKLDPSRLREADAQFLVKRSFDRYYDGGGLLGTVEKARGTVERLRDLQVDELACLIDFGLPADQVLGGLTHLNRLRDLVGAVPAARETHDVAV
jgi:natural product biosynthesis luciferase-like monooxygenase protein